MFWLCCTQCHTMRRDSNWLLVVSTGLYLGILPGPRLVSTGHQQPIRGWHGSSWPIRGPGYTQWPGQLPDIWTPAPMHFWCLLSGLSWCDVNTKLINQMLVWVGPMSYRSLKIFLSLLWPNTMAKYHCKPVLVARSSQWSDCQSVLSQLPDPFFLETPALYCG